MQLNIAIIGHIGNSILVNGGLESYLNELASALERKGHNIQIKNSAYSSSPDIFQFVGAFYGLGEAFRAAKGIPRAVVPLLLHSDLRYYKLRNFLEISRGFLPESVQNYRSIMLKQADRVIVNSQFEKDEALRWGASKVDIIPAGITLNKFSSEFIPINSLSIKYQNTAKILEKEKSFVLSVGRFEKRKNHLNIYKACLELDIPLLIIGRRINKEFECIDELKKYSNKNLFIWEDVPLINLKWAYNNASVHVLATEHETTGLVSLEAAACGARPVSLNYPTAHEYLDPFGEIAQNSSKENLVLTIKNALKRKRLNKYESKFLKKYDWDSIASEMERVYFEILKTSKKKIN